MGIFLYKAALVLSLQAPAPADSVRAALWARIAADSTDAEAWLDVGRAYVQVVGAFHAHRTPPGDTGRARAVIDTAELAFARAAGYGRGTRAADSALVFRVYLWGQKALLAWEADGVEGANASWQSLPEGLRLPPVLEELGENLLRACPRRGILLTAGETDTYASWYMRFARGLRLDLLIIPLAAWTGDSVFRNRVLREARQRGSALPALADRRGGPLCASVGFERAPEVRPRVRWNTRPLVWVAGKESKNDRVPAEDFVFAALKLAIDQHDTWSPAAVTLYKRAADLTSALCRPLDTFGIKAEVGC
ncbi:MAG TPA: hypothetical protein VGQ18_07495 [Gemmatimonadales bacterium]|jgi:hypothetical protein|nr:hypothetical protein [Gemmatimonadales bacterium]